MDEGKMIKTKCKEIINKDEESRGRDIMKIIVLSRKDSKEYTEGKKENYGDCFMIDTGDELVIYDCGSEEHAMRVIEYMDDHGYNQAKLILSHNDADHFDGIPKLLEEKRLSYIYTTLLLKYKENILEIINDGRKTKKSIGKDILEKYDNIKQLSGEPIYDVYEKKPILCDGVEIVGPEKEDMLHAVAKLLDNREGDTIDGETVVNATSLQVAVKIGSHKMLLCGDSSFAAIEDKLSEYDCIQLPHHGKVKQAEEIFESKKKQTGTLYIISDNTGSTNGGSDKLNTKGYRTKNTKNGDILIDKNSFEKSSYTTSKTLGD